MSYYGDNLLQNPGAEDNTDHWSGSPQAVSGGTAGSQCFRIPEGGSMWQTVTPPSGESYEGSIQVSATYLPEKLPARETDRESTQQIRVTVNYTDGTRSTHTCPCEVYQGDIV
jgi:hypothetical protein